ncbi:titin isoform X6 [Esox lucius]|uniref:titin isoform X6 n=1 Tax=Esox lucius TaxID=8010 RepID=UPI0014770233|nr:titin isoform X6 [Esox lucius]
MKSDGVAMATAEPSEELGAEPLAQGMASDEPPPHADPSRAPPQNSTAPPAASRQINGASGKATADPKAKTTGVAKPRPGTAITKNTTGLASGPGTLRPGTAPSRAANGVKPLASDLAKKAPLDKKKAGATASTAAAKRPVGVASTVRTQTKVADRKPAGAAKLNNTTNTTRTAVTGAPTKRPPPAGPSNGAGARPKTTAPKPATTAAAKPDRTAVSKTTRPTTAHSGLSLGTSKPATATSSGPAASRVGTTAPSTGNTTAAQATKPTGPAKKNVSRPPTTVTARKPAPTAATKTWKPDPTKPFAASRPEPAFKRPTSTKAAADTKSARPKPQEPKPLPTRKTTRTPATRQPLGKTPPASPSGKPVGTTTPRAIKRVPKPTQSVLPFTGAAAALSTVTAAGEPEVAASDVPVSASLVLLESQTEVAASTPKDAPVASPPKSPLGQADAPPASVSPLGQADAPPASVSPLGQADAPPAPVSPLGQADAPETGPLGQADAPPAPVSPLGQADAPETGPLGQADAPETGPLGQADAPETGPLGQADAPPAPVSPLGQADAHETGPLGQADAPPAPTSLLGQADAPPAPTSPLGQADAPPAPTSPLGQADAPPAPTSPLGQAADTPECLGDPIVQSVFVSGPELPQPKRDQPLHHDIPTAEASMTPSPLDALEKVQLHMDEEDDDEEREGSQQVSVSEMSGTQPTEESRPGSAGPAGSGWRAGGALLSELDSEEVSAPGVLEGTESTDDLGDASLKGAIDMEGMSASAGSPDFEKVPDIPTNDFEDEEDDRVCDMEVGSEWAEDPRRVRPDDEEDDEDVEMASEGVTESGLESYGNGDEDDFPEDERLDNLNRAQHGFTLPSAPVPQWDQANPNDFSEPWTQRPAPASPLEKAPQPHAASSGQAVSQSGGLTCTEPAVHSSSETSTSEELRDDNASAGVEHRPVDNLNRAPPAPPLPSAPGAQWDQPDPNSSWATQALSAVPVLAPTSPPPDQWQSDLETTAHSTSPVPAPASPQEKDAQDPKAQSSILSAVYSSSETSTSDELHDYNSSSGVESGSDMGKHHAPAAPGHSLHPDLDVRDLGVHLESGDGEAEEAAMPLADENPRGPSSNPSSSSTTEDEASDTEGEAQLDEAVEDQGIDNAAFIDNRPCAQRCLSALEEGEETGVVGEGGGETPQSANSVASYAFDMTASNSNGHSTAESCAKSPGIFSLEELPEEAKDQSVIQELTLPPSQQQPAPADPLLASNPEEQQYMLCGKVDAELGDTNDLKPLDAALFVAPQLSGEGPCDTQPPYYSIICDNTENSAAGLATLPQSHHRREYHLHAPKPHCDLLTPPRLTCADLPPRSPHLQASPQLRRLELHQQQLLEMQQRREQLGRPHEEKEEEERKRRKREQEEEMKKKEAEEQEMRRRDLLQQELQKQQEELKQRQQILQWQQELKEQAEQTSPQPPKGQSAALLSPSSGLHTIYEALESEDEEEEEEQDDGRETEVSVREHDEAPLEKDISHSQEASDEDRADSDSTSTFSPPPDSPEQGEPSEASPKSAPVSPECSSPPPLDLDWGKKVDMVQQLINQTLLLTGDGCSSLLLLPGGGGGTLSPLEASLWPNLLPPLTPPSATVTSVSSFSPEAPGQSQQGEWTVVELETHH